MPSIRSVHFSSFSLSPPHSLQIKNVPPGFKTRKTSRKLCVSSGQKQPVSNAVTASNHEAAKIIFATLPCHTAQRSSAIASRLSLRAFSTLTAE